MRHVQLGGFTLDIDSQQLSRAGRQVHLPAQSAKLLTLLVSRAPEIVSREEIRRELWGDDLHVEFDSAVNACISQIRSALHDSARAPRFIETVPRRGYRCLVERSVERPLEPVVERPNERFRALTGVAAALLVAIGGLLWTIASPAQARTSTSLQALQKYERGVSGLADAGPMELLARVRHFETAIESDPDFAAAYAGLADAKLLLGAYRVEPAQIAYAAAKAAAQKALAQDDSLAEAHAAFGTAVLHFEWDWMTARQHLRRAIALDPKSSRAQLSWSRYLTAAGEHAAAIAAAKHAVALAPGSPSALTQLGIANYYAGRADDARSHCGDALAVMREFTPARACVEASDVRADRSPNLLLAPAIEFVRNGDRERAIDWLQRAANRRSDSILLAGIEPALQPLRSDPRFTAVLRRIGTPGR
jgi:DNA-binding winged helix-turn-helix (wHTH) protein/tetratricopeptide (TPR) repeat protein